jgi:hypothetical protein
MKAKITFMDHGAQSVSMESDIDFSKDEVSYDKPTPAVILAMATKAMFNNGMLARAGQAALKGISEGRAPEDCVLAAFQEKKNDDTDS